MTKKRHITRAWTCIILLIGILFIFVGCHTEHSGSTSHLNREPALKPDISGITVPVNIAPVNFDINEEATVFYLNFIASNGDRYNVKTRTGKVRLPLTTWRKLIHRSGGKLKIEIEMRKDDGLMYQYNPVYINIADSADQYLCYRLLYPGYETYYDIKILQRDISSFKESSVVENQLINHNCINCHSSCNNDPCRSLIHARGDKGGTYFIDGDKITRIDFRSDSLPSGAVYPAWRMDGKFVAFSSNNIRQSFHARNDMNIEVTDLNSKLVLYNVEKKTLKAINESDTTSYMDTFPEWSPDGRSIYFCRAKQYREGDDPGSIHYNLMKRPFSEASESFGPAEMIFDAAGIGKSVSFPRISPDGKYLVFTIHNYGNFSIWHKEADLYLLDIQNNKTTRMNLNSDEAESWHCWSSNSKWLVFSSKRDDGLTARPYFAYIGSVDQQGKPFILPQKDPDVYQRMIRTFNRPEFLTGKIRIGPRDFAESASKPAIKPLWE